MFLVGCKMKGKAHKMTSRDKTKQDTLMLYNVGYCFVLELYRKRSYGITLWWRIKCHAHIIHNDVHYVFECFTTITSQNAV